MQLVRGKHCGNTQGDKCPQADVAKSSRRRGSSGMVHHFSGYDYWSEGNMPSVVMVVCETPWSIVPNTCHCCAERRLVSMLREQARREGVAPAGFSHWVNRKHGPFTVVRLRRDGEYGISLPCVICRKMLDGLYIRWRAHIGSDWVTNETAPPSRPTQKQRACVF